MSLTKSACLVNYSSSESSEEEDTDNVDNVERKGSTGIKTALPLPGEIRNLFVDQKKKTDDSSQHQGRIRSFPHEEGSWATHIFIPYDPEDEFRRLQEQLFLCLRPLEFNSMSEHHISLSRTVPIRHHWIPEITKTLKRQFSEMGKCCCEINGVKVYVNDEKTRSFLGLDVSTYCDVLEKYVQIVDSCFEEYKLQKYYQPPSFHISVGWCLGDVTEHISHSVTRKLQNVLDTALNEDPELRYYQTGHVQMRTGNKVFNLPLNENKRS